MKDFDRSILVGVVFDLTPTVGADGVRAVDVVKEALLKKGLDSQVFSRIYVSHPDWQSIPRDQGESTYYVASYKEPPRFSVDTSFKNAITMIGECVENCDKYVFLITDRFQAPVNYQYRKGFLANGIRGYETKVCVFGIGDNYDKMTLQSLSQEYDAYFAHLPTPAALSDKMSELFVTGS